MPDDLAWFAGMRWAAPGEVVPLPPVRQLGGAHSWQLCPEEVGWRLADGASVLAAIQSALRGS